MEVFHYKFSPFGIGAQFIDDSIIIVAPKFQFTKYKEIQKNYNIKLNIIYIDEINFQSIYNLLTQLLQNSLDIDRVFTLCESDIEWTGFLDQLLFKNESFMHSIAYKNKFYMRCALLNVVKQPMFCLSDDFLEGMKSFRQNAKILIKPTNLDSASGIKRSNYNQLLVDYKKYRGYVFEEEIDYDFMVTCDGVAFGTDIIHFSVHEYENKILDCIEKHIPLIVKTSSLYQTKFDMVKKLFIESEKIIKKLNFSNTDITPFHFEWFISENTLTFCEAAIRFGGGNIPFIILHEYGINLFDIYWNKRLISKISVDSLPIPAKNIASYLYPQTKGVLKNLPVPFEQEWVIRFENKVETNVVYSTQKNISEWSYNVVFEYHNTDFYSKVSMINKYSQNYKFE